MVSDSRAMTAADFDTTLEEFVQNELDENPVLATNLGAEGYDDRIGDLSEAGFQRRDASDCRWLERIEAVDPATLDAAQRLDRELVLASLRGRVAMQDWAVWRRNPDTYLGPGLQGVFSLFLHRLRPDAALAASAASRLREVPAAIDAGMANLDPSLASPVFVERAKGQCAASIRYARELLPAEVADGDGRAELAAAGEVAAQAFERFAAFLDELGTRATGDYAIGETRYTTQLQTRELLDLDTAALQALGREQYDALAAEMAEVTERIDGTRDWHAAVERLNDDHPPTFDEMRDEYATWTETARRFLAEHDLVGFPTGEECRVVPSPPFQRPVLAVAFYVLPPPLRPGRTGHFFVPYPPDGVGEEETRQRLRSNSRHEIPTVSVHEAYPGHHWHLVVANGNGRPVRHLLRSSYFAEGWALYAERMMRREGFFTEPTHELMHLKDRLFRAARIVVDTSLHTGAMGVDDAVTFMMQKVGLPEPTARAEVHRYCSWPTQASSYLTGSLMIERLREKWFAENKGTLRQFHDQIAALGCMPVKLHEQGLFAE